MGSFSSSLKNARLIAPVVFLTFGLVLFAYFLKFQPSHEPITSSAAGALPRIDYRITKVLGQPNDKETMTNRIVPSRGFHLGGVHVDSQGRILVFDSGNNRILGFSNYALNKTPDIVLGQPSMTDSGTANGDNTRYLNPTASTLALLPYPEVASTLEAPRQGQMATDTAGNVYIVDLNNNRVLKYNDPFTTDTVADEVWGQSDFTSRQSHCGQPNYEISASTLCTEFNNGTVFGVFMAGVEIDPDGNLWVTDTGNNRILRFPMVNGAIAKTADVVLGQSNFTSRAERSSFDTSLTAMRRPIALKFRPSTGELYVMEGETAGEARVTVFMPPFSTAMSASREFGRAQFQDTQPSDTTNWQNIGGKWVHVTTGLAWARGLTFVTTKLGEELGLWVNDGGNRRAIYFTPDGQMSEVIGRPGLDARDCFGGSNQGYIAFDQKQLNFCNPGGEIGYGPDGALYFATDGSADSNDIIRFPFPIERNDQGLAISDGTLLHSGWNQYSGQTFFDGYGMSFYQPNVGSAQLFVSDRQRLMAWNDPEDIVGYSPADYIVGQDNPNENITNNHGIFSGIGVNQQSIGGGYLWVSSGDRIFAFTLPIQGGGKNYQPAKVLYSGSINEANVVWADEQTKVNFNAVGIVFDESSNSLWVADNGNNRVLRIKNPITEPQVDLVIGQPGKTSTCDYGCLGSMNAKGFADPWTLQLDKLGNLYVIDSKPEGGASNRVMRFDAASLISQNGNIFPFLDATGVYTKKNFTTTESWGSGTPQFPIWVSFDSQNRMLLLVDSYGNPQYERAFVYDSNHATQVTPQPGYVLPIAFGQAGVASYLDDSTLIIQDHTWNRILFIRLNNFPPTATPTPTMTSTPTMTPSPMPTLTPTPTPEPLVLTEFDDNSYRIGYEKWNGVSDIRALDGAYHTTKLKDAELTYKFTNASTRVSLLTYKGPDQGKLKIYIDGSLKQTADLYATTPQYQARIDITGLSSSIHTIRVVNSGSKNSKSTGLETRVDAFEDTNGLIGDNNANVTFGHWLKDTSFPDALGGGLYVSNNKSSFVEVKFTGTSIVWLTRKCMTCGGKADIYIDGVKKETTSFYNATISSGFQKIISNLTNGPHTLKIQVLGSHSSGQGSSNNVYIDGFQALP